MVVGSVGQTFRVLVTAESEGTVRYRVVQFLAMASILSSLTLRFRGPYTGNPVGCNLGFGLYDARFGARRGCGEVLSFASSAPTVLNPEPPKA